MSVEVVVALVISVLAALGHFVKDTHIKKCKCFCVDSDCIDGNLDKKVLELEQQIEKKTCKLQSLKQKRSDSSPTTPSMTPAVSIAEIITEAFIDKMVEKTASSSV